MKKILLIAGTGDSTAFLGRIPENIEVVATTVSDLGADCVPVRKNIQVRTGALDEAGFVALLQSENCEALVDMSHPFAVEVSAYARAAALQYGVPYLRYQREGYVDGTVQCRSFPDALSVATALNEIEGNILLTTGSKTLPVFKEHVGGFDQRCYLRVLASSAILKELEELDIDLGHVFAMKGVASKELNIALAKEVGAVCIVSKNSGITGGIKEKSEAAKTLQIPLFLIDAPKEEGIVYQNFEDMIAFLQQGKEVSSW